MRLFSRPLAVALALAALNGCSAETTDFVTSSAATNPLDELGEIEPDSTTSTSSDATTTTDGYVTQGQLDALRRAMIAEDEYLKSLIDKEAEDRKAADDEALALIEDLNVKFAALESLVLNDQKVFKEQVADLQAQQTKLQQQLETKEAELLEAMTNNDDALARALQEDLDDLRSQVGANETAISANSDLIRQIDDKVALLNTKIAGTVELIGRRIDDVDLRLSKQEAAFADFVVEMRASIRSLGEDMNLLESKMDSIAADFERTVNTLAKKISIETKNILRVVKVIQIDNLQQFRDFEAKLTGLTSRVEQQELLSQTFRSELSGALKRITEQDDAFTKHKEKCETAKQKFFEMIEVEQEARKRMGEAVSSLVDKVENNTLLAKAALQTAKATATAQEAYKALMDQSVSSLHQKMTGIDRKFTTELAALKQEMTSKLVSLEQKSYELFESLGKEGQQNMAALTSRVARLEARSRGIVDAIVAILSDVITNKNLLADLLDSDSREIASETAKLLKASLALQETFIAGVEPIIPEARGVDWTAINLSLTTTLTSCSSKITMVGDVPELNGYPSFFHLAAVYVGMSLRAERFDEAESNSIFTGEIAAARADQISGYLRLAATPDYTAGLSSDCRMELSDWATQILSTRLDVRSALSSWEALTRDGEGLNSILTKIDLLSANLDKKLREFLAQHLLPEQVLDYLLNGSASEAAVYGRIADVLVEAANVQSRLESERSEMERMLLMMERLRGREADIAQNSSRIDDLAGQVAEIRSLIKDVADASKAQVDKLTGSVALSFKLIAGMAARLGFADIAGQAAGQAELLDGSLDLSGLTRPSECVAVTHSYLHALPSQNASWKCTGNLALAGESQTSIAASKCAVHSNGSRTAAKRTWGNTREGSLGWNFRRDLGVGNGLFMRMLDLDVPEDKARLKELAARKAGSIDGDRDSALVFNVFGFTQHSWKMEAYSVRRANFEEVTRVVSGTEFHVSEDGDQWSYRIPFNRSIGRLGGCHWDREVKFTPVDAFGEAIGPACVKRIHTFSPIVLDFSDNEKLTTLNPLESGVLFDLNANGIDERTGWIPSGRVGFLALDLNGNQKIDDGSELFGQATDLGLSGKRAEQGYQALAQYDRNGDRRIDQADPIFDQLIVWFDRNVDGLTQTGETRRLKDLGVTQIDLSHQALAEKDAVDHQGYPEANLIKYEARFHGPKACGAKGCKSYDVFFGATESFQQADR